MVVLQTHRRTFQGCPRLAGLRLKQPTTGKAAPPVPVSTPAAGRAAGRYVDLIHDYMTAAPAALRRSTEGPQDVPVAPAHPSHAITQRARVSTTVAKLLVTSALGHPAIG